MSSIQHTAHLLLFTELRAPMPASLLCRYAGAGMGLTAEDPINPQYSLRHSNHPLAPFPGEPLKWISYVYDDGTTCVRRAARCSVHITSCNYAVCYRLVTPCCASCSVSCAWQLIMLA